MEIDKSFIRKKNELLEYFRNRASESITEIKKQFAENEPEKRAKNINNKLNATKSVIVAALKQRAEREKWTNKEILECMLMITYCHNVVMIDSRNSVRLYEYMDFSRRIGELWDPFCKICFYFPSQL